MRGIDDDEGKRLVRIVRRGTGSAVTWQWAQMVLVSARDTEVAGTAKVAFTGVDHVRDVIHDFNADGFDSLHSRDALIVDDFSARLTSKRDHRVGAWAEADNVALDDTDHHTHQEQGSMIRRYITWRNRHVEDLQPRRIANRANIA